MFSSGITLDNSNRLIKNINNDIIIKLNNITNLECIQNTVGQKSISKNELIKFINDLNI